MRRVVLAVLLISAAPAVSLAQSVGGTSPLSTVLVCVPLAAGGTASVDCGNDVNGNPQMVSVVSGYVLNAADYATFQLSAAPFDYGTASSLFGLGVFLPLVGFLMSYPLGLLVRMLMSG